MSAHVDHARAVRRELTDVRRVCSALGLLEGAKRQAGGLMVRCPAHDDRTPSCSIRIGDDGTIACRCHGCGWTGDALGLVAVVRGLDVVHDFRSVLVEGARIAGLHSLAAELGDDGSATPAPAPTPKPHPTTSTPEPARLDIETFDAIVRVLAHVGRLDDSPLARDVTTYLAGRGVLDEARACRCFALAPASFQGATLRMLRQTFGDDAVRASGLVSTYAGRWAITHAPARLCIPWCDTGGRVVTLQRRRLDDGSPKYVFPSGQRPSHPFGVETLAEAGASTPLIYCEGAVDVLALRVLYRMHGITRVVLGLPGVSAWRREWADVGRRRAGIIGLDGDDAGERGVARIAADLRAAGAIDVRRERPRAAKDWAEVLVRELKTRGAA